MGKQEGLVQPLRAVPCCKRRPVQKEPGQLDAVLPRSDARSVSECSYSAPVHAFMWLRLIHFQVIALKALIPLSYAHEVVVLRVLDKQCMLKGPSA